ncbi:3-keto-disaccharide hydrolase [Spirosoma montaniterrae]|uniref:3-keto-alpha-glucoside-1,2-lyase/3-keto-2-hydroxy-glucal hydratase domain-containing protein n=1 Tax=Spirosoma montaniterrae TaxID=1178516 RepID=A0A1P9WTA3_9BACT|nr:DUF1080 domain-containing protein [Spirosoma montaniterrae]AQG78599.1 hypothetical protein AWR27_04135 [Spirosoma montaniterrae]
MMSVLPALLFFSLMLNTPLFDGRSFRGWEGDTARLWHIRDGALVGGSLTEMVKNNDFLCTTRSYKNFELTLNWKLVGTGFVNAGVQFRSQRLTNPAYEMTGYQADLGKGYWGCLYDESRRNTVLARPDSAQVQRVLRLNDWNEYKIRCNGPRIQIWLNGLQTVDYTEPDPAIPQTGVIGLQIHGGGKAEASYKNISIEELP